MFENLTPRTALPSLNALRAFEAMGRTGSATRAAAELNVTHSAISRQVKALEAAVGVRLFEGPKHQLRLTVRGEALRTGLGAGFDTLTEAVRAVRDAAEVHLAIHQSLAVKNRNFANAAANYPNTVLYRISIIAWLHVQYLILNRHLLFLWHLIPVL